jgi:hypothetical protein
VPRDRLKWVFPLLDAVLGAEIGPTAGPKDHAPISGRNGVRKRKDPALAGAEADRAVSKAARSAFGRVGVEIDERHHSPPRVR